MGAGLAVPYALAPRLALPALSPAQAGQGSGIVNACTFLGGSAGVAGGAAAFALGGFVAVLAVIALAGLIGAVLSRGIAETGYGGTACSHSLERGGGECVAIAGRRVRSCTIWEFVRANRMRELAGGARVRSCSGRAFVRAESVWRRALGILSQTRRAGAGWVCSCQIRKSIVP